MIEIRHEWNGTGPTSGTTIKRTTKIGWWAINLDLLDIFLKCTILPLYKVSKKVDNQNNTMYDIYYDGRVLIVFPSALKLYKIHNKGPLICQLNVEFEDFQSMKFSENSNFTQYFQKSSVWDKNFILFYFYIWTEYISSMNSKRFWTERGMRTGMLWEMPGWFHNSDAQRKSDRKYLGQNGKIRGTNHF